MEQSDMPMLKGVPETMLQTLYARARQSQSKHPLFSDKKAEVLLTLFDFIVIENTEDCQIVHLVVNILNHRKLFQA